MPKELMTDIKGYYQKLVELGEIDSFKIDILDENNINVYIKPVKIVERIDFSLEI